MVDSVSYWMKEYKVDGFRFDLMGLHDLETMRQIEQALHQINPSAIIYGEGWSMGSTVDGSKQANQTNIKEISATNGAAGSVALFNDVIRDGLKGSVFNSASQGYINGAGKSNINAVKFGINGASGVGASWSVKIPPSSTICLVTIICPFGTNLRWQMRTIRFRLALQ